MTISIDIDSLDRLISNAGLGSFELGRTMPPPAARPTTKPRVVRVSQDFLLDLNLAGRHVMNALSDLIGTDKGRDALMFALDGTSATARTPQAERALTDLLHGLISDGAGLQFLPAVNITLPETAGDVHTLPHACTCALGHDLGTVYCSAELGFRDLFQVIQTAAIKALIMRAEPLGVPKDAVAAFVAISDLLGSDAADPSQNATVDDIDIGTPTGPVRAFGTSMADDT